MGRLTQTFWQGELFVNPQRDAVIGSIFNEVVQPGSNRGAPRLQDLAVEEVALVQDGRRPPDEQPADPVDLAGAAHPFPPEDHHIRLP